VTSTSNSKGFSRYERLIGNSRLMSKDWRQVCIISKVLSDEVNVGYEAFLILRLWSKRLKLLRENILLPRNMLWRVNCSSLSWQPRSSWCQQENYGELSC